ncbi:unnamed protein product [Choristocarpus tenellus]
MKWKKEVIPEAVKEAIATYQPGEGWRRANVPPPSKNRSPMFDYGVRLVLETCESNLAFRCMADENCRKGNTLIKLKTTNTSPGMRHLRLMHRVQSQKSMAIRETKLNMKRTIVDSKGSPRLKLNLRRFLALDHVKVNVILGMQPLSYMEHPERQRHAQVNNNTFPIAQLDAAGVTHVIREMYHATENLIKNRILKDVKDAGIPIIHLMVDIFDCKVSENKYLGAKISYNDSSMIHHTFLLAVKLLRPSPSLGKEVLGQLVLKWVVQVLGQFSLSLEDIVGVVTNSSLSIKSAFDNHKGVMREGCIAHLLAQVTREGTGMSMKMSDSKNLECRTQVFEPMLREFLSAMVGNIGLERMTDQVAQQRWISVLLNTLVTFLKAFDSLNKFWVEDLEKPFPCAGKKQELLEVYTIIKAIQEVTEAAQSTKFPSAPGVFQRMMILTNSELNTSQPLTMRDAKVHNGAFSAPTEPARSGEDDVLALPVDKITGLGKLTREVFSTSLASYFRGSRYGVKYMSSSHLFDMMMALCPGTRKLSYIDRLAPTSAIAYEIKKKVWQQVHDIMVKVIVAARVHLPVCKSVESPGSKEVGFKNENRPTPATSLSLGVRNMSGLFDDSEEEEEQREIEDMSAEEAAVTCIKMWRDAKIPVAMKRATTGQEIASFWVSYGKRMFPYVFRVAQAVLGCTSSSVVLKSDFSLSNQDHFLDWSTLDPAISEMLFFLQGSYSTIPDNIPILSPIEALEAVPDRLKDPVKLQEVAELDVFPLLESLFVVDLDEEEGVGMAGML